MGKEAIDHVVMIAIGLAIILALNWWLGIMRQMDESRRRAQAKEVLLKHGMVPHLYLASIGIEDMELRAALDVFAFSGTVVLDRNGNVVGKLVPAIVKEPRLRLVVNNDG